jgi:hypothetical protein
MRGLSGALRTAPIVMLAALVAGLVESADLTLLPLFGIHAGFDERAALLLITVFMAGNVILQLPIGLLADRLGRRFMLGICAATGCVGPLLLQRCLGAPMLLWPLLFVWGGTVYAFYSQHRDGSLAWLGTARPAQRCGRADARRVGGWPCARLARGEADACGANGRAHEPWEAFTEKEVIPTPVPFPWGLHVSQLPCASSSRHRRRAEYVPSLDL